MVGRGLRYGVERNGSVFLGAGGARSGMVRLGEFWLGPVWFGKDTYD